MNDERIKKLETELTVIEDELNRRKEAVKTCKESFDEKLIELRAEITRDDKQQEMSFQQGDKKTEEVQFEVEGGTKQLEPHNPLSIPENTNAG